MPASLGTVIRLDMTKDIRTREPMTFLTPDIDIRGERGFKFIPEFAHLAQEKGRSVTPASGKGSNVRLFRDPFPLSREFFLVLACPHFLYQGL
jgi:hypothetical protein